MDFFSSSVTKPYIQKNNIQTILEIGASMGDNTRNFLLPQIKRHVIIDPGIDCNLADQFKNYSHIEIIKNISLNGLKQLSEQFDCIFIDGDHNWYTVFNELSLIAERKLLSAGGVVFFHDVGWPYGRRDMYYTPDQVPAEFRQPFAQKGIIKGHSELSETKGLNAHLDNAFKEGGSKNGVLTAIEDFLKTYPDQYYFTIDHRQHGLGLLIKKHNDSTRQTFNQWKSKIKILKMTQPIKQFIIIKFPIITKLIVTVKRFLKSSNL